MNIPVLIAASTLLCFFSHYSSAENTNNSKDHASLVKHVEQLRDQGKHADAMKAMLEVSNASEFVDMLDWARANFMNGKNPSPYLAQNIISLWRSDLKYTAAIWTIVLQIRLTADLARCADATAMAPGLRKIIPHLKYIIEYAKNLPKK